MTARTWQDIQVLLFTRYETMAQEHLDMLAEKVGEDLANRVVNLSSHAIANIQDLSEDKANRWLGFVQGVLTVGGVIDVEHERDFTRPLFHELKGVSPSHAVSSVAVKCRLG